MRSWPASEGRMADALRPPRAAGQGQHPLQRLPLHHVPDGHGNGDGDRDLVRPRALADRTAARAPARGRDHSRGHAGAASQQGGHSDHGRTHHPGRPARLDAPVDESPQSIRLGTHPGHGGLRGHRSPRRLAKAQDQEGHLRQAEIRRADPLGHLTDGLDGLAIGPIVMAGGAFAIICYLTGNFRAAEYLKILNVKGTGELTIFCGALVGAAVGFLWFNSYPAQVFMGDVGSLALGGAIGTLAVLTKAELLLPLIGGLYVVEAASVIIQVASFKLTGRRVFKMAPLHHHYEMKGWAEPKIIVRFWIVSIMLALQNRTMILGSAHPLIS